jgi:hypothetical protein
MWDLETKVIPVIIRATGTISKSLGQYLSYTPGRHEVKKLQTTAIFGTQTVESADITVHNTYNMGNNITFSTNCKYRIATTAFFSGI